MRWLKLSILERYLLRDIVQVLASVLLVLLLIILSNQLARFLQYAAAGTWPTDVILPMLGLTLVNSITIVIPIAVFLAVILAVGRFYKDSEMTVISGCGVSMYQLYRPLGLLAIILAVLLSIVSFMIVPQTLRASAFLEDNAEKTSEITGISPGRFQESSNGNRVIYIESSDEDKGEVKNVFVYSRKAGKVSLLTAKTAYQIKEEGTGDTLIVLRDGYRYAGEPGRTNFRVTEYDMHWVRAKEGKQGAQRHSYQIKPTTELLGSDDPNDWAELNWRIAMVLSPILFTLLGLPLGRLQRNEGRYGRVMVGVLIYLIYFKLLQVGQVLLEQESIPAWLGMWWIHAGLLAYLGWALLKEYSVRSSTTFSKWRFRRAT